MDPHSETAFRCPGTMPRRAFLRAGAAGLGGLTLADVLRQESRAASTGGRTSSDKSMIVLWLWGGPSHMETFDLKPGAPAEFRGEFDPIPTNVPGLDISEHLPLLAKLADKFALIRSCSHDSSGHVNSTHTLWSAYKGEEIETPPFRPKHPDLWAIGAKLLGERASGMPSHVALPHAPRYSGSAYLGGGLEPFVVAADPSEAKFKVPNLALSDITQTRFSDRLDLLGQFDQFRKRVDASGLLPSMDAFNQKAATLLTSPAARSAFDLEQESSAVRDTYGRHKIGQQCLLARRLVEAGARFVTIDFPCVPGQKAFSWDDHASVWNIFEQMKIRLPVLDQVVSALVSDIHARGLQDDVLLLVMGEMSHTPRLSNFNGNPGREHWGQTMSLFLSGGGMPMGQAVGATNSRGDEVVSRLVTPNDVLATWYKYLGIPVDTHFNDAGGRPTPIVPQGRAIAELI